MAFKEWKEQHQALWEFILFNILSNVSTLASLCLMMSQGPLRARALASSTMEDIASDHGGPAYE